MKSPKDILALGREIVRELNLDERGEVLQRWLAHHLAQQIAEAEQEVGAAKAIAEQRAVDLILRLWTHRRALPEPVDPLGGYRDAISVLGRLMPDADPWGRYRRHETYEDLLHEMFATLTRVVLGGILLTQVVRSRPVSSAEAEALEGEETWLRVAFEDWMRFFTAPTSTPKVVVKIVGVDAESDDEELDGEAEEGDTEEDDAPVEQQAAQVETSIHAAIVANLERMQTDLAVLLTRWKASGLVSLETGGD
ncbi:hypothetical protein HF908_08620 [Ralstonia pseudosolanacearum]|uniref:hypothetical protein n=1 Tax=Ralstonia pseudosolanacearum TaxID=1310165 RepID=UPI001868F360|nr:hypothetical protein [Ralstonia pseudosolanacearum]QOK91534.1 hypothetical protein HF908_08620 [Ralstonia pseudosolanacearum]